MKTLEKRLTTFLQECPLGYHYVAQCPLPIPSPAELELLEVVETFQSLRGDGLAQIREPLVFKDFYTLTTFAVRMAIHAVRTKDKATLQRAVVAFLIDHHLVDYRDVLARVAVINDCSIRLGADFEKLAASHKLITYDCRWKLMQGFFKRTPAQKEIRLFGHTAHEGPDGLEYH